VQIDLDTIGAAAAALAECEEALAEGANTVAREALDTADMHIAELREHYKALPAADRPLLAQLAKPLSARREQLAARVPALRALGEIPEAEREPEDDGEPEA
jgi:hypothetical protein